MKERDIQVRSNSSRIILLGLFASILLIRLLIMLIGDANFFPINRLKIKSSYKYVTREQVQQTLTPFVSQSFLSLSTQDVSRAIKKNTWIEDVKVKKIWPDRVDIQIFERFPIAYWNKMLVTKRGILFQSEHSLLQQNLPHLYGPKNQQLDVLHIYKKLSKLLKEQDLYIAKIKLRDNHSWVMMLTNGIVMELGKNDIELRVKRFSEVYSKLFAAKFDQVSTVDLRYSKGMAVKWRKLDDQINKNTKT
jgi:cell division protein FtsQ